MTTTPSQETDWHVQQERTDGPVHTWFSLSYANFLVWHRSHMQSMPVEWQQRFVELAEELDAAYPGGDGEFDVNAVEWTYVSELTDDQMKALGVTTGDDDEEEEEWDGISDREWPERVYYLKDGTEVNAHHYVAVPAADPVPHYNRGRTYLPPDEGGIAAHLRFREQLRAEGGAS